MHQDEFQVKLATPLLRTPYLFHDWIKDFLAQEGSWEGELPIYESN